MSLRVDGSLSHQLIVMMKRGLNGYPVKGLEALVIPPEATDFHQVERVIITGTAGSYHVKSLAGHALIAHCHAHGISLDNQIKVPVRNG